MYIYIYIFIYIYIYIRSHFGSSELAIRLGDPTHVATQTVTASPYWGRGKHFVVLKPLLPWRASLRTSAAFVQSGLCLLLASAIFDCSFLGAVG